MVRVHQGITFLLLYFIAVCAVRGSCLKTVLNEIDGTRKFFEVMEGLDFWQSIEGLDHAVLLVPNDAAMEAFPKLLNDYYFSDTDTSREKLAKQIAYHVLPGISEINTERLGKQPTLHGSRVLVEIDETDHLMVDASPILDGPYYFDHGSVYVIERFIFSNVWK